MKKGVNLGRVIDFLATCYSGIQEYEAIGLSSSGAILYSISGSFLEAAAFCCYS